MKVTKKSMFSGKENTMDLPITQEQYIRWALDGELIQDVMPELTSDQREFIISGVTPEEWDCMFSPEDDYT